VALLAVLCEAIEARPYERGHGARVTALAEQIALRLGWSGHQIATLRVGGRLHDVGKLAVAENLLRKAGALSDDEYEQIRAHAAAGVRFIEPLECFSAIRPYVLYHHERWDGGGYPTGRRGPEIPIEARVLAVADAFDAMTSARPYRRRLSIGDALAEIDRCAGTQFDPDVARVFLELWEPAPRALPTLRASTASA
jgi:HD-GYP domain-containing protein (c-di-GMP phosphodiesterase class II)